MSRATASRILRKFGGHFSEKGEFVKDDIAIPRRYRCTCNPNGFVSGQAINHLRSCPFSSRNIQAFLGQEPTAVLLTVAILVFALCGLSAWALGTSIHHFGL